MASNTWAEQQWLGSVLANGAYRTLSASNCGARIRFSVSRKNVYIWMPGGVGSAFMSIHEKLEWRNFTMAGLEIAAFADPRPLIGVCRHASGRPRKYFLHGVVIRRGGGHATARIPRRAEKIISGANDFVDAILPGVCKSLHGSIICARPMRIPGRKRFDAAQGVRRSSRKLNKLNIDIKTLDSSDDLVIGKALSIHDTFSKLLSFTYMTGNMLTLAYVIGNDIITTRT